MARSAAQRARHAQETRRWRDRLEPAGLATALSCETIPALRIFYNRDTVKTPCESKDITIQNNSGLSQGLAGLSVAG